MEENNYAGGSSKGIKPVARVRRTITMDARISGRAEAEADRTKRTVSAIIELALENYLGGFDGGCGGAAGE